MRKIFTGLHSLFMLSFCLLLLLEITSQTDIGAGDIDDFDNESLSLLNSDNGNRNEILILNGATLIDGNDGPPKSDSVIVIGDNKKIVAVTNQTNFRDNPLLFNSNEDIGSQITKRVLNVTGKYIMPGLFDMHAHVAGVRKNSYDLATSENMLQMLLDYGVTTVRNPGGPTNETVHLREEIFN
jgi:imidazolonepropionase-like amidohydrolase